MIGSDDWIFFTFEGMNAMKRMRKFHPAIFIATFSILASGTASAIAATSNYAAFGDSITFGYGLTKSTTVPSALAYPNLAAEITGMKVYDEGVSGLTSDGLIQMLQSGKYDSILQNSNKITVDIGSNDLLQTAAPYLLSETTPPPNVLMTMQSAINHYAGKLNTIIQKIQTNSKAELVLFNLYNPLPPGVPLYTLGESEIGAMNKVLVHIAYQDQLPVVDVASLFRAKEWLYVRLLENDVHPNALGQSAIAAELLRVWADPKAYVPKAFATITHTSHQLTKGTVVNVLSDHGSFWKVQVRGSTNHLIANVSSKDVSPLFYRYEQSAHFHTAHVSGVLGGNLIVDLAPATLTSPILTVNHAVYAPLTDVAHALGYTLAWQPTSHNVWITGGGTGKNSTGQTQTPASSNTSLKKANIQITYSGIGIDVNGARMPAPQLSNEPFFYQQKIYIPVADIGPMFDAVTKVSGHSLIIQRVPPLINQNIIRKRANK